jgi:hypothetical protein
MARGRHGTSSAGIGAGADQGGLGDLAAMAAEFPEFAIWQEYAGERVQYIARRNHGGVHPHTIVTSDPAELRTCLTRGR